MNNVQKVHKNDQELVYFSHNTSYEKDGVFQRIVYFAAAVYKAGYCFQTSSSREYHIVDLQYKAREERCCPTFYLKVDVK